MDPELLQQLEEQKQALQTQIDTLKAKDKALIALLHENPILMNYILVVKIDDGQIAQCHLPTSDPKSSLGSVVVPLGYKLVDPQLYKNFIPTRPPLICRKCKSRSVKETERENFIERACSKCKYIEQIEFL